MCLCCLIYYVVLSLSMASNIWRVSMETPWASLNSRVSKIGLTQLKPQSHYSRIGQNGNLAWFGLIRGRDFERNTNLLRMAKNILYVYRHNDVSKWKYSVKMCHSKKVRNQAVTVYFFASNVAQMHFKSVSNLFPVRVSPNVWTFSKHSKWVVESARMDRNAVRM